MSPQVDYTALAHQFGGKPAVDYTALAKQFGGAPGPVVGAEVQAQRDADARGTVDDPNQHGFWHSFYDLGIKPIVDQVRDAYQRGDVGAHAADEMLRSLTQQLGDFAASGGDIRKLPVIGTGATDAAQRMQDQVNAGNPLGAVGSAAGFVAPFALGGRGNARAAADGAVATKDAIVASAKRNSDLVRLGVKMAAKGVPGAGKVIGVVNFAAKAAADGAEAAPAELTPGQQLLESMRRSNTAQATEDAAYQAIPDTQGHVTDAPPAPAAREPAAPLPPQGGGFNLAYQPATQEPFAREAPPAQAPAPAAAPPELSEDQLYVRRLIQNGYQGPPPAAAPPPRVPIWQGIQQTPKGAPAPVEPIPGALPSNRIPGHLDAHWQQFEAPAAAAPEVAPPRPPIGSKQLQTSLAEFDRARLARATREQQAAAAAAPEDLETAMQRGIDAVNAKKSAGWKAGEEALDLAETNGAESEAPTVDFKARAQATKAIKVADWLTAGKFPLEDILRMNPDQWNMAAQGAGVSRLSGASIKLTIDRLKAAHRN